MVSLILKYWHTVRYLKIEQIYNRVWKWFKLVEIDLSPSSELRPLKGEWIDPAKRPQRLVGEQTFCFLNETHEVFSADDWNNREWSKLWLYNLHYFDDLTAVDAVQREESHRALIQRWVDENSPGRGNGWEAYPSSLRIVNWIKWSLTGKKLENDWLHSLSVQIRLLSKNLETHLMGNHLFVNAKALLFAGLFFDGAEAEKWYQIGLRLVEQELPNQVLKDGGNFELSTMYHLIFLEDLLDLVNIHGAYKHALPNGVEECIAPMFHWLENMCHPDGEISFFNDSALGVTPSTDEIKNYLERISEFAGMTGFSFSKRYPVNREILAHPFQNSFVDLAESGFSRVELKDAVALIDRAAVGPDYLPGHGHADSLSFELSLFGQRVIVNSGTSVYGTGEQRQIERGTASHSTVVVDGENSSEVWGGFRVARRARVFDRVQHEVDGVVKLSACHDGYRRLSGKPVHCREWVFEEGKLTIHDVITGRRGHKVESVLPLHPDTTVVSVVDNVAELDVVGNEVVITVKGEGEFKVFTDSYHPEFGMSIENRKLIYKVDSLMPVNIFTEINW